MAAHVVDIQTQFETVDHDPSGLFRYRWRCSCGRVGPWQHGEDHSGFHHNAARAARNGGGRHVAAMERR